MTAHPGFDAERLEELTAAVERDIAANLYFGGVHQRASAADSPAYLKAFGHSSEARSARSPTDSVFSLFSVTKAFTNILVFQAIERGLLTLTTPLCQDHSGILRRPARSDHDFPPADPQHRAAEHVRGTPGHVYRSYWPIVIAAICEVALPMEPAGMRVDYAPLFNHALLGEAARRVDPKKRSYREILHEDLFEPLGMKDTSMGVRRDLKARHSDSRISRQLSDPASGPQQSRVPTERSRRRTPRCPGWAACPPQTT